MVTLLRWVVGSCREEEGRDVVRPIQSCVRALIIGPTFIFVFIEIFLVSG